MECGYVALSQCRVFSYVLTKTTLHLLRFLNLLNHDIKHYGLSRHHSTKDWREYLPEYLHCCFRVLLEPKFHLTD